MTSVYQSWALIRSSDGVWLSGPMPEKPIPSAGQAVVFVPPTFPLQAEWDPATRGFVDLPTVDELLADIDARAGAARLKYITCVPGQSDAYREKMVDVASLNGLGGTTALILSALGAIPVAQQKARWPFLWAEKEARGLTTLVQARDAITAAADASRAGRAEIERVRRAGKIAVLAATTASGRRAAAAAITWPS